MRIFRILLVIACLCASQSATLLRAQQTIQQAVRAGTMTATFEGMGSSSGDSIKMKVRKGPKAGPGPVEATVPPGTKLASSNGGFQSMVVTGVSGEDVGGGMMRAASNIVARGAQAVSYILTGYCAEFEKENPSSSTTFTLGEPDPVVKCLSNRGGNLSLAAMQAAVWMYTDKITYAHMSEKFDITRSDWDAAQRVFSSCQSGR